MDAARPLLCLACRDVVLAGEDHEHEGADVVDLAAPEQRQQALVHLRDSGLPKIARVPTRPVFHAIGTVLFGVAGGAAMVTALLAGAGTWTMAMPVSMALYGAGFGLRWRELRRKRRERHSSTHPFGAVTQAAKLNSIATGTRCAAYMVELRDVDEVEDRLSLRHGVAMELEIQLEDGRIARIPEGPVRVDPAPARCSFDRRMLDRELFGTNGVCGKGTPVPYNQVHERCVRSRDLVAIENELVAVDREPNVYRPLGTPVLRVLIPQRKSNLPRATLREKPARQLGPPPEADT